jgi:hypothetical protein
VSYLYKHLAKIAIEAVNGIIDGIVDTMGKDGLELFIKNKWSLVEGLLMMLNEPDEYIKRVSPDGYGESAVQVKRAFKKVVEFIITFSRQIASHVPDEVLNRYLSYDYVIEYIRKNRPDVAQLIESYGEEGREWFEMNLKHIKALLRGQARWNPFQKRLELTTS